MQTVRLCTAFAILGAATAQQPAGAQNRPQNPAPPRMGPMQPQRQQPQAQPPDFSALKSYLDLTDAQIRQIQQAREKAARDAEEKTRTLRPQVDEKHRALADMLDRDNADPTAVGKAMLEIRALERQMRQAHEAVRNAGLDVMTAAQKTKFKAIQDAAMLPQATREAQRLGLVPPSPGQGPNDGPRPRMQGQPVPGPPMRGPGPGQPQAPPGPPRQGEPEGGR